MNTRKIECNILSFDDIVSQIKFSYVTSGILMTIIVTVGIMGNIITLSVLFRKRFRNSVPVCLLQCLTIHALANLANTIFSDIEPAFHLYYHTRQFMESWEYSDHRMCKERWYSLLGVFRLHGVYSSSEMNFDKPTNKNINYARSLGKASEYSTAIDTNSPFRDNGEPFVIGIENSSESNTELNFAKLNVTDKVRPDEFIRKALERFFTNSLLYLGLALILVLTVERLIVVLWPLRASKYCNICRVRMSIVTMAIVSCVANLPQLVQEIEQPLQNTADLEIAVGSLLVASWRKMYMHIYTISSLCICFLIFILNMYLLVVLFRIRKQYRREFHHTEKSCHGTRREVNLTVFIAVSMFLQLPVYICMHLFLFIAQERMTKERTLATIFTIIRLSYVAQSAFSFVVYCVFAQKIRKMLKTTYGSMRTSPFVRYNSNKSQHKSPCHRTCAHTSSGSGEMTVSELIFIHVNDQDGNSIDLCY